MINCPNCNKELEDGSKFCDGCGTPIEAPVEAPAEEAAPVEEAVPVEEAAPVEAPAEEAPVEAAAEAVKPETIFCQNCGKETSTEFAFCQNCGASLEEGAVSENTTAEEEAEEAPASKLPFKLSKKLIAIGGGAVAVILVIAILLSVIFSAGGGNNCALYVKDDEIFYTGLSKIKPWQVTDRLVDDDDIDNDDLADSSYRLASYVTLSKDGKNIFFVDKINEEDDGATIFYRPVGKDKKEPIKLDSDVYSYSLSENGKLMTYLKYDGDSKILYQHNLKDKEKIASEVSSFKASDDGKTVFFTTDYESENYVRDLYVKKAGKDKEKVESEIQSLVRISDDFKTVYFVKDDTLYKKVVGKDKVKIASDVTGYPTVFDDGTAFYVKDNSTEIKLSDYLEDDKKEADANVTYPDYPYSFEYDTTEEYTAAYNAYQEAVEEYYNAYYRNNIRENIEGKTTTKKAYSLYYYNGKEEKLINENVTSSYPSHASDAPVAVFSSYVSAEIPKVKISEVESIYQLETKIEEALYASSELYVTVKDKATKVEVQKEAKYLDISEDGETIFFLDNYDSEKDKGELYKVSVNGSKVSKAELYDSDVCDYAYFISDEDYLYFKDVKDDSKGELYLNKKLVDSDVSTYYVTYNEDDEILAYMTDWNSEKARGTLKQYKGGKAVKIADDVHNYIFTNNSQVLYLKDYSLNSYRGDLFLFKGKKSVKVDSDVVAIIPYYND